MTSKKATRIFAAAVMAVGLAACHKKPADDTPAAGPTSVTTTAADSGMMAPTPDAKGGGAPAQ